MSSGASINKLRSDLSSAGANRLILLYGDEDYYIDAALGEIKRHCLLKGAEQMDYCKIDFGGKDPDLARIEDNTMLPPWLSPKRLVLVVDSGNFSVSDPKKELQGKLTDLVQRIPESSVLVFRESSVDKRKKALMNLFEKQGSAYEFSQLTQSEMSDKLSEVFGKSGLTITPDALDSLMNRSEMKMRIAANEYLKIRYYCMEKNIKTVDYDVIERLCVPDYRLTIFQMLDSLSAGDAGKALTVVQELIEKSTEREETSVIRIKFMLCRHLRELICAQELKSVSAIMSNLKVKEYPAKKLSAQASKFNRDKLLKLYSSCVKSDYECRMGKLDPRQSLEILLVLACNSLT